MKNRAANIGVLLALLAVVCTFALTTAALTPLHGHPQRHCSVCVAANLPFLTSLHFVAVRAPLVAVWLRPELPQLIATTDVYGSSDPRGPPYLR